MIQQTQMKNTKGIYKITSPSGKIYIGQSTKLLTRYYHYQSLNCKGQPKLFYSLKKHGFNSHLFEIVYELPSDIDASILTCYEQFCIDQYREAGIVLMNIKEAGNHGGHSEETKKAIGLKHKGKIISDKQRKVHSEKMKGRVSSRKGKMHTEESKVIIREKRALQENIKGCPLGNIPWNKGLKGAQSAHNKGISPSSEVKEKIRNKLLGRKLSPETIAKRTATLKKNGVKRKWSDEAKKRQSEKYLGKTKSSETIEKGRVTRLLRKLNSSHAI